MRKMNQRLVGKENRRPRRKAAINSLVDSGAVCSLVPGAILTQLGAPRPAGSTDFIAAATKGNAAGLRVFFSLLLLLLVTAGFYMLRNRQKFFGHRGDVSDSYASANLRMWLVILIWIHAVLITALMIYEV